MNTDFNKKGLQVKWVASKIDYPYFDILQKNVIDFSDEIEGKIASCNQCQGKKMLAEASLGCFERFRGCIMQISRISHHEIQIRDRSPQTIGEASFVRGAEVLTDFESLLFHGRGTIDRLTFFITKQIYGQCCDEYPKLVNVLNNFTSDSRATALVDIVLAANSFFEGVLFDAPPDKKSLRSHLIHKSTAGENTHTLFTLHYIAPNKRIAFDSILGDYPLFKTTMNLGRALSFVVLNTLSLYIGNGDTLPIDDFNLKWKSKFVDYRDYISESHTNNRFTLLETTPSGCILSPVSLRPEIASQAY